MNAEEEGSGRRLGSGVERNWLHGDDMREMTVRAERRLEGDTHDDGSIYSRSRSSVSSEDSGVIIIRHEGNRLPLSSLWRPASLALRQRSAALSAVLCRPGVPSAGSL